MFDLNVASWALLILGAMLVGFAKTGVSTIAIFTVILMTQIFPAKESVGILLPMLIVGDLIAVTYYRRSVVWKHLFSLIPWVMTGLLAGYFVLLRVNSEELKLLLGLLVLALIVLQVIKDRLGPKIDEALPNSRWFNGSMGILAGFTTMVGNVAGVIMAIYLLTKKLPKQEFVGTGAWFFLFVNVIKVPFYIQLGMITAESATFNAMLIPAIAAGAYIGIKVLPLIPQKMFQRLILILGAIGAGRLIIPELNFDPVYLGYFMALSSALSWAFYYVFIRKGMSLTKDNGIISTLAVNLGVITLLLIVSQLIRPTLQNLTWPAFGFFFMAGVFSTLIGRFTLMTGIRHLGSNRAVAVKNAAPVVTVLVAVFFMGESLTWTDGIALLAIGTGIYFIFYQQLKQEKPIQPLNPANPKFGLILAILSAFSFGIADPLRKAGIESFNDPIAATFIGVVVSFFSMTAVTLYKGEWRSNSAEFRSAFNRYYVIAGFLSSFAILSFFISIQYIQVVYASVLVGLEPVLTLLLMSLLMKGADSITKPLIFSISLVFSGTVLLILF